jgi:cell division protein FtsQ
MPESMPVLREPKPNKRSNRKLLAILLLLFAVVLTVLFFRSSLSKISSVSVTGQQYITAVDISKASGIGKGDAFFYPGKTAIEERIAAKIKQIDTVKVEKHFPGEISITVTEHPAVAFELSDKGEITAILSNGSNVVARDRAFVVDKPVLSGWKPDDPLKAELTKQLAAIPQQMLSDFSEIIPFPSKSYKDRIKIYTRTEFEVITAISLLKDKVETLDAVVETQEPGRVTMLLADTYAPYVPESAGSEAGTQKEATQ